MSGTLASSISLILSIVIAILINLYTSKLETMEFTETLKTPEFIGLVFIVIANIYFIFKVKATLDSAELSLEAFRSDPDLQSHLKEKIKTHMDKSKSIEELVQVATQSGQILKRGKKK